MKTILIPTDFSESAENAAYYALHLAAALRADLTLCHAFVVPAEIAVEQAGWPLYEYSAMEESTLKQLDLFAAKLKVQFGQQSDTKFDVLPAIHRESEVGTVSDMVHNLAGEISQTMIVMGMTGVGGLSRFFLGSISHHLISHTPVPILLIPTGVKFQRIKRIAFATNLENEDVEMLRCLAALAGRYNADLVISHVQDQWGDPEKNKQKEHLFLDRVRTKINYPKLYLRNITDEDVDNGLKILSREYQIDMIVMVHKNTSFLGRLFNGSYSQTLAKQIKLPLLVIPQNLYPIF